MRHRVALRVFLAAMTGFGAAALAGVTAPAAAAGVRAAAEPINCCQVGLSGLPDRFGAGAPPQFFTVTFQNGAGQRITRLSVTFTVSAPNAHSGQLHLQRRAGDNWHTVNLSRKGDGLFRGTDYFSLSGGVPPGAAQQWTYQAWASKDADAGPVQLVLTANGRLGDGHDGKQGLLATSGTYQTSVVAAGAAAPTPTETPSASPSPTDPTPSDTSGAVTGPTDTGTTDPAAARSGRGGGMTWIAYTVGALLLLGAIAMVGTMLWRRGPQDVETEWDDAPPPAGSPARSGHTATMPAYGPAEPGYGVPPPVDPYDTSAGAAPYAGPTGTVIRPAGGTYGSPTTYGTPRTGYDIPRQRD